MEFLLNKRFRNVTCISSNVFLEYVFIGNTFTHSAGLVLLRISIMSTQRVPQVLLNPFLVNVYILYPLKTPENLWFSGVFRGYKMAA